MLSFVWRKFRPFPSIRRKFTSHRAIQWHTVQCTCTSMSLKSYHVGALSQRLKIVAYPVPSSVQYTYYIWPTGSSGVYIYNWLQSWAKWRHKALLFPESLRFSLPYSLFSYCIVNTIPSHIVVVMFFVTKLQWCNIVFKKLKIQYSIIYIYNILLNSLSIFN